MSLSLQCPKCGYSNRSDAKFCGGCATPLSRTPNPWQDRSTQEPSPVTKTPTRFQSARWATSSHPLEDSTAISRTQTGILLLAVGLLLGPIPYLMYVGVLLEIIGAILVIIGRKPFGQRHSDLVKLSVGIWVLGTIISIIVTAAFAYDLTTISFSSQSPANTQQFLTASFNDLLIGILVSAAILGIAIVLITFALQTSDGRTLLIMGYVLGLAVDAFILFTVIPQINAAVSQAISTQTMSSVTNLQTQIQLLGLIGLIPAAFWAVAYYLAYSRIANGKIPTSKIVPAYS